MHKKKICLVIPTLQAGGMERVMSELAVYFCRKSDLEVYLILYSKNPEVFYNVPENLRIYQPQTIFKNNLRFAYSIGRLIFLRKKINKIKPDSILSFGEYWNSFVLLALIGLSYPIYISDRCSPAKKYRLFHSLLRRLLYRHAKGIIAQTEKAKDIYFSELGHNNINIIGNPIRAIEADSSIMRENIVLMVGRLIKTKHQDKLIELFIRLSKPGWKLVIVGYDHLKQKNSERLMKIIKDNHVEDSVLLEGKKANVETYYLKSKIFAFTSSSEGFPNVIGEAMSACLPVIAFDCIAGPSEMINNNKNGFLIPLFDYEQFQEKLEILMNRADLRELFGNNANESIKVFSISRIGEQYLQFILNKNVLSNKS